MADLITEAARKAGVLWIAAPGRTPVPAWQVWRDGRTYVLTGPGEQDLPGLADAADCEVVARSADTGGRIATWRATVERVEPDSDEWREIVPALTAARLNGHPDWTTAVVLRLTPAGAG
ncbi:MAG TPA: hypothetical protein VGP36_12045 [Mycobacteriales bacterium]|nr:hypothetical protein [Mycobacteriales bacterium]